MMEQAKSVTELISDLTCETRLLVQQEVSLAKREMAEKIRQMERGATQIAIGSAVLYGGVLVLLATAVIALAYVFELWLAALIVGVLASAIGFSMVARGREQLKANNLELTRTRRTIKEEQNWVRGIVR